MIVDNSNCLGVSDQITCHIGKVDAITARGSLFPHVVFGGCVGCEPLGLDRDKEAEM